MRALPQLITGIAGGAALAAVAVLLLDPPATHPLILAAVAIAAVRLILPWHP